MGLFSWLGSKSASGGRDPYDDSLYSNRGFWGWGRRKTASGKTATPESSLHLSAYYACIRNISEDIAKARMLVMDVDGKGRKVTNESAPSARLLNRPSPDMTRFTMIQTTVANALGWGNGYQEIIRDNFMRPVELVPHHPSTVIPKRNEDTGELEYEIYQYDLSVPFSFKVHDKRVVKRDDMIHLVGLSPDGLVGYSVVRYAAEQMGEALAAQEFGGAFYGNGMMFGGFLEHPGQLSPEAYDNLREANNKEHKGASKAHKIKILEEGMKFSQGTIPPRDAQFIEGRRFHVEEIARWFRMPPHKIMDLQRSTNNNIEEQSLSYLTDTLHPWMTRLEEEFKRKLIPQPRRVVSFQKSDLLPTDLKTRAESHRALVSMGIESPNQARAALEMNTADDEALDRYYMQSAMLPIERLGVTESAEPLPTTDGSNDTTKADMEPLLNAVSGRVTRREEKAIAGKKEPTEEWLDTFYEGQEDMLIHECEVVSLAFAQSYEPEKLRSFCQFRRDRWDTAPSHAALFEALKGAFHAVSD